MKRRTFLTTIGTLALAPVVKVQAKEPVLDWRKYPLHESGFAYLQVDQGIAVCNRHTRIVPAGVAPVGCNDALLAFELAPVGTDRFRLITYERT